MKVENIALILSLASIAAGTGHGHGQGNRPATETPCETDLTTGPGHHTKSKPTPPIDTKPGVPTGPASNTKSKPTGPVSETTPCETDITTQVIPTSPASGASSSRVPSGPASSTKSVPNGPSSEATSSNAQSDTLSTSTNLQTTVVTVTSCTDDQCSETPVTTAITVVPEEETVYTTYCPLTKSPSIPADTLSTSADIEATLVTVTSCSGDNCTEKAVTTGVNYITDGKKVEPQFNPLPTGSSTEDDGNDVTASKKKIDGNRSPEDAAPSNEASSTEATNDSQSGAAETTHQLDAAVRAPESTPSGSEANDSVNTSQSSAPEKTRQLVAAVSTSVSAPSGSQTAGTINTYEGLAAMNKPWALSFAALAAIALL